MKEDLRKFYKIIRKNITNKELKDKLICDNFLNCEIYKNASIVLAYYPMAEEINIRPIIISALAQNKKVALPVTLDKDGDMEFYFINSLAELVRGNFGIMEPKKIKKNKVTDFDNSVCIVPGICFDLKFNRLGYGKGYYDRFLSTYKGVSVGLCYHELLVKELPRDKYDKACEYICVDEG